MIKPRNAVSICEPRNDLTINLIKFIYKIVICFSNCSSTLRNYGAYQNSNKSTAEPDVADYGRYSLSCYLPSGIYLSQLPVRDLWSKLHPFEKALSLIEIDS